MVFVEQPAGVGFSPAGSKGGYTDASVAADNRNFIMKFLEKFPNLAPHDFYISSESYGGHYLPTLAKELVEKGGVSSFKGVIVGNPLTYMPYRDYGYYATAWGHQLLPKHLWDEYISKDCAKEASESDACYSITSKMNYILQGLDPYALDFPTCSGPLAAGQQERLAILGMMGRASKSKKSSAKLATQTYQPCSEDLTALYLNLPEVKKAIHAKDLTW
eukprot:CAMPEP_0114689622 /NCGR_PEP_ID=MMETSP0191-20121206/64762_1 /TAXON_ID=126664 /ORGANISM="Sorites sp." /LENGTH=217 /DNA_ID=CAMNT_0001978489 /DNA_START=246 /DNA_END=896 /DNA_ORIENTATION=+